MGKFLILRPPLLIMVFILAGCGRPRIDTSTDERMKKSIEAVRASVPTQERDKFDKALVEITASKLNLSDLLAGSVTSEAKIKESLNGKTAAEVIVAGQAIVEERLARERKEALAEIAELRKKMEAAEQARTQLAKFKVMRSRFYKARKDCSHSR